MTTHPTMTPTFESAMLSFSPGVNSRAELVTLASSGIIFQLSFAHEKDELEIGLCFVHEYIKHALQV